MTQHTYQTCRNKQGMATKSKIKSLLGMTNLKKKKKEAGTEG